MWSGPRASAHSKFVQRPAQFQQNSKTCTIQTKTRSIPTKLKDPLNSNKTQRLAQFKQRPAQFQQNSKTCAIQTKTHSIPTKLKDPHNSKELAGKKLDSKKAGTTVRVFDRFYFEMPTYVDRFRP